MYYSWARARIVGTNLGFRLYSQIAADRQGRKSFEQMRDARALRELFFMEKRTIIRVDSQVLHLSDAATAGE